MLNDEVKMNNNELSQAGTMFEYIKRPAILWGAGNNLLKRIDFLKSQLNIIAVCDTDCKLHGRKIHGYYVSPPDPLKWNKDFIVIITPEKKEYILEIANELNKYGVQYYTLEDALKIMNYIQEESFVKEIRFVDQDPFIEGKLKYYIPIHVPANECNLQCSYCYLDQREVREHGLPIIYHSPKFIRHQLSKDKIGGVALLDLCGSGETMLSDKFNDICCELIKEGHLIHICTNGTIGSKISELIESAGDYARHIFFKISFHYEQLKERNLLSEFEHNVSMIENSQASFSLEILAYDELIPLIPEIQTYSIEHFGALPHISVGRDESQGYKLLSKLSLKEYFDAWKCFDSKLFEFKISHYMVKSKNCNAGSSSFVVTNLLDGHIVRC
ncbi:MAG: hypothetical protein IKN43_00430, partial [Selenomonadaceae bacterium]|nr:hypothetical protein [Selenomonadaceae bacterium]